jgi:4-amino-4-deoxy-L-arabinose transferase-like glycosyltransferase
MTEARRGRVRLTCLAVLWALALWPGLGSSGRLSYHEAFVAQGAREILGSGTWGYPTIGGLPWLEKPPLPWWLVAALGRCAGGVNETVARFPSALAAMGLVWGVAVLAGRHYGPRIGLLAGAVQATTVWTVMRGRLAEADMLLACLVTWALAAFDRLCLVGAATEASASGGWAPRSRRGFWDWVFFALLGGTALVKGIGFGAILIVAVLVVVLAWQRARAAPRRLWFPAGWFLAAALALAWPLSMVAQHGRGAFVLWTMHVADRLAARRGPGPGPFAGEPWWEYVPGLLVQALPWTPLALAGAWRSLGRAVVPGGGTGRRPGHAIPAEVPEAVVAGDRLLWSWAVVPSVLLSLATVKNAHYVISAQIPWSIWAALALARLGEQLRRRGWDRGSVRRAAQGGFTALALAYGLGFWLLGPRFDRRGAEWAFYESAAHQLPPDAPLILLYDDWDRDAYPSPFGSIPHDLAVRLFYLGRPACWHVQPGDLVSHEHSQIQRWSMGGSHLGREAPRRPDPLPTPIYVIGRDRDLPALERLGRVQILARGPSRRWDRTYVLFRVARGRDSFR